MVNTLLLIAVAVWALVPTVQAHYETRSYTHNNYGEYTAPRVVDNTGVYRNTNNRRFYYGDYPYMNPNLAKRRPSYGRSPNATRRAYRNETAVELKGDRYCDWVTHFDTYYDGIGWVDYERIVRECDQADGYIRYYGRDARRHSRYTTNSYNKYDSYYWSDGVQTFNTYGW